MATSFTFLISRLVASVGSLETPSASKWPAARRASESMVWAKRCSRLETEDGAPMDVGGADVDPSSLSVQSPGFVILGRPGSGDL
jgi:hypothetical protein